LQTFRAVPVTEGKANRAIPDEPQRIEYLTVPVDSVKAVCARSFVPCGTRDTRDGKKGQAMTDALAVAAEALTRAGQALRTIADMGPSQPPVPMPRWPARLNVKEAAEYLGISDNTLRKYVKAGHIQRCDLPHAGPGFRRETLDGFLQAHEDEPLFAVTARNRLHARTTEGASPGRGPPPAAPSLNTTHTDAAVVDEELAARQNRPVGREAADGR